MKKVLAFSIALGWMTACHKKNCNQVVITSVGTPCSVWGFKKGNQVYAVDSIPDYFKQEGMKACAEYKLYQDNRTCICCGGIRAHLLSIRNLDE